MRSIDEYIAAQPARVQRALKRMRSVLRRAVPGAAEVISYKMPAYRLRGRTVLYFAGWERHVSLYPASRRVFAKFKNDIARYEVSKGTIRFSLSKPLLTKLIERIARFRAKEIRERER